VVVAGANAVEVRVANLWVNRLIGDAQPGVKKVTFTAAPTYTAEAPLRPAGLIGPVTIHVPVHSLHYRIARGGQGPWLRLARPMPWQRAGIYKARPWFVQAANHERYRSGSRAIGRK
jgi:hypothetical protein